MLRNYLTKPSMHPAAFCYDRAIIIGLFLIICTGLLMIYSAGEQNMSLVSKQAVRYFLAILAMVVAAVIPRAFYFNWIPTAYIANNALLACVLVAGHIGKGAQRWLYLGPIQFEPSEFTKIILIL